MHESILLYANTGLHINRMVCVKSDYMKPCNCLHTYVLSLVKKKVFV